MSRLLLTPGKDPVFILQEAGWAPEPVWTGAENLAPAVIRCPDRPPLSQSLYRLSYPAHRTCGKPLNSYLGSQVLLRGCVEFLVDIMKLTQNFLQVILLCHHDYCFLVTFRPLFTSGKDPVPIVQDAGWAPLPVWTGTEYFTHTGIRSPDRPARSQSLY
jgi:hypothetical protein